MYKSLNSLAIRQLGIRTNITFRHVNQYHHRAPISTAIRLVIIRPNVAAQRGLHMNRDILRRSESKLGKAVATEEKETMTSRAAALAKEQQAAAAAKASTASSTTSIPAAATKPKKTIWQKVKAEAVHYWHGTQLLGLEFRISSSLTWKLLHGGKLTRREHRQVSSNIFIERGLFFILTHNKYFYSYVVLHLILCDWSLSFSSFWYLLWNFYYLLLLNCSPVCYLVLMKVNLKR
jgi:hypothetical protein